MAWSLGGAPSADISIATSTDEGKTFGNVQKVVSGDSLADAPKLSFDNEGRLYLVYSVSESGLRGQFRIEYRQKSTSSSTFGEPKIIADPDPLGIYSARFPRLGTFDDSIIVLWERYDVSNRNPDGLNVTYSASNGTEFNDPFVLPKSGETEGINGSLQGLLMQKLVVNRRGYIAVVNSRINPDNNSKIQLFVGSKQGVD